MANILFINTNRSWNKGSAAQVVSTIEALRRVIPDANFALISHCPELDSAERLKQDVKVVGYFSRTPRNHREALMAFSCHLVCSLLRSILWRLLSSIRRGASFILNEAYCHEYLSADVVIDLSGDSLSDRGGRSIINLMGVLIALVLRKPVVVYSQSVGPFTRLMIPLARACLNKVNLILVREEISKKYLETIGVTKTSIYEVADCAFALTPARPERAGEILTNEGIPKNDSPLVGISVSEIIVSLAERDTSKLQPVENEDNGYFALIARLVDFLIENIEAHVVLIPHVIAPTWWLPDDRFVCERIYDLVKNKTKVDFIKHDYTPEELKGIIGQCDLFVGSRMHACIAALSMHVPTVALGWSHKYEGIMERLGVTEYVCDFDTVTFEELIQKVSDAWSKSEDIRKLLASRIEHERKSALYGAELVKNLMDSLTVR